jgi:pSer/pThr/pTyr-binding forkhead associated (FHA) protein
MDDSTVLAVIDNGSGHATWVDGRLLVKGEQAELKHGMILTFGQSDEILSALSFRCNIIFSRKPSARRLWRFQESLARIERKNKPLSNTELASYMPTFSKNHDDYGGLTLDGLLLLHKEAGMQSSWFDVPLAPGATVRIKSHLKHGSIYYENANTKQEQDELLSSFKKTMIEFMNNAYAFVDGEARCLTDIRVDLKIRAQRTITPALRQIEGVLSVGMAGGHFVAKRDPKIPVPPLSALQRVLFQDGLVTFEDVVGIYKDD